MRQQNLYLVDIVGKDLLDPSCPQLADIAKGLLLKFPLQGNPQILKCVICADMGKDKSSDVSYRIDKLANEYRKHPCHHKLKTYMLS